jgi:hypothetical protein
MQSRRSDCWRGSAPLGRAPTLLHCGRSDHPAAYVVISIVGGTWTIEECGDRDSSGARVGAILQALIAREPVERRHTIRAWLPRGFVPPQVTIVSAKTSTEVMMVRPLGTTEVHPRLSGDDVLYWRSDIV